MTFTVSVAGITDTPTSAEITDHPHIDTTSVEPSGALILWRNQHPTAGYAPGCWFTFIAKEEQP